MATARLPPTSPLRARALDAVKLAWLVFVAVFLVVRVTRAHDRLAAESFELRWIPFAASTSLLFLGRLVQVRVVQTAASWVARRFEYARLLWLFSITDLGRYVPAGLAHFLGRGLAYSESGISRSDILRAFALENVWLALGASWFGVMALASTWQPLLAPPPLVYAGATALLLAGCALSLLLAPRASLWPGLAIVTGQQIALWALYGLNFWLLCRAIGIAVPVRVAAGALSLAWVAGFVSVFAPAGLGVREYVLVLLLTAAGAGTIPAAVVAVVHRLQWVFMELTLSALGAAWSRRRPLRDP